MYDYLNFKQNVSSKTINIPVKKISICVCVESYNRVECMVSENGPDRSKHQHQGDGLMTLDTSQAETAHDMQAGEIVFFFFSNVFQSPLEIINVPLQLLLCHVCIRLGINKVERSHERDRVIAAQYTPTCPIPVRTHMPHL